VLATLVVVAPAGWAQNVCPSGVVGTPDEVCVFIQDQITGATATVSGSGPQAIAGTVGDYTLALVASGSAVPTGAAITLAGTVTRTAFTAQPALQGLVITVDYGQVAPIASNEATLSLTGSATGTTLTRVEGEIGYPTPLADVLNFRSVGNTTISAPTTGGGSFVVSSGEIPVDSGGVAARLVTQFIPNALGDVITIPADVAYGVPITPGGDAGLVTEVDGAHYSLDELLVREADDFCPLPYFKDDPAAPVFALEGTSLPDYGPCGVGTFEEMRIQRASFLEEDLVIESPIVIPTGTAWVIEEGASVLVLEGGSISVEEGAAIVVLGELLNQGQLFVAPDSTVSVAGQFANQGFVENGGNLFNQTALPNDGRIELCEAGFESGSGVITGNATLSTSMCVPEPAMSTMLVVGGVFVAAARGRRRFARAPGLVPGKGPRSPVVASALVSFLSPRGRGSVRANG
jgi:hypothetical protein